MAPEKSAKAGEVHWSRDYVEHLRTVHFALIGASAALIILVLTKPYDIRRAISEVRKVSEIKQKWSSDWMRDSLKEGKTIKPRNVQLAGNNGGALTRFSSVIQIEVQPQGDATLWDVFELTLQGAWMNPVGSIPDFPNNLNEMKTWWNDLARPIPAAFADSLLRDCVVFDMSAAPAEELPCRIRVGREGRLLRDLAVDEKSKLTAEAYRDRLVNFDRQRASGVDYYDMSTHTAYWFTARYGDKRLARVYAAYTIFDLDQSLVARAFDLHSGPFDSTFRDLVMAGRNSESVPLDKLEAQLEDELAKGGDNFEAFGVKLPGDQVSTFGIVVLLCAQLYLLLYLKQLGGKLTTTDDGWNVPWMALEGSWLGQSMYAVSLVAAPVAVYLLRYGALHPAFGSRAGWLDWISFLIPTLLSVTLAVACWYYRPLRNEQVVSPETRKADSAAN